MKKILIFAVLILCYLVNAQPQAKFGKLLDRGFTSLDKTASHLVVIYFKDKGNTGKTYSPQDLISDRSIKRRLKVRSASSVTDDADLPLEQSYVSSVSGHVTAIRYQLKWFNAVSALATKAQIEELRALPMVKEIDLIGRWKVDRSKEKLENVKTNPAPPQVEDVTSLNYGSSYTQLHQINVPAVHDLGLYGQGVVVGVFDNGFRLPSHIAFSSMNIIATYDFVDHKVSVVPNNTNASFGSHGINTLSAVGGYAPGNLIGPAFGASYILARTENDSSETPIEEDNWAKGIEWADSIGVDVTSTSLGYLTFDAPYTSLTWQDMDGVTALITRAADRADSLGIVVVNAAGNERGTGTPNTLIAPADGFNVITAGAVDSLGNVAGFSSYGPTFDGRTKPDIAAMGVSDVLASATNPNGFGRGSGTSFATPLSAGVAALILCANPGLTPAQVRDAMRNTASKSSTPDNNYGWGILDAYAAVNYFGITNHLSGNVFIDYNGNGIKDAGEALGSGIKIRLAGSKVDSIQTDAHGRFLFDSLQLGTYAVSVDYPGAVIVKPDTGNYAVTLDSTNRVAGGLNFAAFVTGSIHGSVFNDVNHDGVRDSTDSTLVHWPVSLTGPVSLTAYTDSNGNFSFTDLGPGTYTVRESLLTMWVQTTPQPGGSYSVTMLSGLDTAGLRFGNTRLLPNTYPVKDGWNMISLPVRVMNSKKDSLYPQALSSAFIFQLGYKAVDSISNGTGFWLKFSGNQMVPISGTPITTDTIVVHKGWNMIGSISDTVQIVDIIQIPDSIVNIGGGYYAYSAGYTPNTIIEPGRGYWVKASSDGILILHSSSQAQKKRAPYQLK